MTDWLGDRVPDRRVWRVIRLLQAALVAVVSYALVTVNVSLGVNAVIPLVLTLLPTLVRRAFDHELGAGLSLWIAAAAFLHVVGALGPYAMFGWYDSVTHTVSATLVAGVGYATVNALDQSSESVDLPSEFRFLFILIFVLAFGVIWEIAEFAAAGLAGLVGSEPVLAQYGTNDIVFDLVYNTVGALLVALWGTGYFDGVAKLLGSDIAGGNDTS